MRVRSVRGQRSNYTRSCRLSFVTHDTVFDSMVVRGGNVGLEARMRDCRLPLANVRDIWLDGPGVVEDSGCEVQYAVSWDATTDRDLATMAFQPQFFSLTRRGRASTLSTGTECSRPSTSFWLNAVAGAGDDPC